MEDEAIIELYWTRSEDAISQTKTKYGRLLYSIAMRILRSMEDSEECENDTYMRAWNSMPPQKPDVLSAFLSRITRNLALDRYDMMHADKRGGAEVPVLIDELEECIPDNGMAGAELGLEMKEILNRFLASERDDARKMFVRRYFFGYSVKEIAQFYSVSESKVKMTLMRQRTRLGEYLGREGVTI